VISGFIALLVWSVAAVVIAITIWRRKAQLVSKRGMGVRADLLRLHEVPRVRVKDLTMTGPDAARLALVAADVNGVDGESEERERPHEEGSIGLEFSIEINESEPGWPLLREWIERQCVLGCVMPPDSRIIRLRCLEDLQPLTLRRLDPRT
jgi:hypothetical protein